MNPNITSQETIDAHKLIAAAFAEPQVVKQGGIPFLVIPEGYKAHDVENLLPHPARIRQQFTAGDSRSFIDYSKRFKQTDTTLFYTANEFTGNFGFEVVMDFHGFEQARWGAHKAIFIPKQSEAWQRWSNILGDSMSQAKFIEFLDEFSGDIHEGAGLLDLIQTLEGKQDVKFTSKQKLADGSFQLGFSSENSLTGAGNISIPTTFNLGIPIYENGTPLSIPVKFRFNVKEGAVSFKVVITSPEQYVRHAQKLILDEVLPAFAELDIQSYRRP